MRVNVDWRFSSCDVYLLKAELCSPYRIHILWEGIYQHTMCGAVVADEFNQKEFAAFGYFKDSNRNISARLCFLLFFFPGRTSIFREILEIFLPMARLLKRGTLRLPPNIPLRAA